MKAFTLKNKKYFLAAGSFISIFALLLLLFSACSAGEGPAAAPTAGQNSGTENGAADILLQELAQTQTAIVHVLTATLNAPVKPPLPAAPGAAPTPGKTAAVNKISPSATPDFPVLKCDRLNYPSFGIVDVVQDKQVSISTCAFPADKVFTLHMGTVGGGDVDDIKVGSFQTGKGGSFVATYKIPEKLLGSTSITIWAEFEDGFTTNNWFYNSNTRETK